MPTPDYLVDMLQKRFGGLTLVTRDSTLPTPEFGFYVANEVTTNISGAGVKAGYARQPFRAPKMTVKSSAGKTASVRVDAITGEIKSPEIMFSEGTLPMLSEEQRREILATYLERKFGAGFAAGLGKEMDAAFGNRQYSIGGLHKFISGFVAARGKSLGDMQPLQFGYDIFKTVFAVDQEGKPITPESEQNVENLQRYGIGLVQNTARELWSADTLRFNIENIKSAIRKQQPELTEEEIEQKARSIYKIEPAKRDGFFIVQPANQVGWVMPFGAIPKAEYAGKGKIALPMVRSSLTGREREIYEWMGIAPSQLSQENPEETAWRDLYRWAAYQKSKVFSDEIGISEDKVFRVGGLTEEGQARLLQAKRIVDTYDPNAPNDLERMMKELARTLGNGRDITGQHIILEETGAILPTIRSVMSALEYSDEATGQQKSYGGAEVARLFKKQIDLAIASLGGATEETYARRDEISSGLLEYVEDVFAAGENAFKQLTTKTKGFVSGTYRYDTMTFLQDEEVYIPPQVRHRMLINAGFSRKEIKAFERAFAKGELKTSMPILFQRSPDIGFSLFMNAITDKDLMNRIRAAGTKISRKDFDRLIRNDISFQNIVFVSQRASELQTGDFDRDIASIVALVKKKYDKDGNLTFETPQVEGGWANFVNEYMEEAARTLRAAYGEEFSSLVSAAEGAASDVVEGKNPLGKGKFASFSAREALDVSVDRRAQMTVGMGTTYNVKRYLAPAMSLTGASDEDIARALTQTQANYQVFLDTLATGTPDTTGTPLSTILSSASIHLGEDETPYLSFSTDTAYTTQERTVGGKKVEADIVGRNRRVRILAGDPASTYAGFLQALNIAAKRKVLKKGGKAHEYEITPPDLIYNIAALNEEMRREMKSYAVEKYGEKHTSEQAAFAAQVVWGKYIQQGDKKQRQLQVMQTPLMRSLTARALQKSESGEIFGRDEVQRQWLARRISAGEAPMEIAKDIAVSAMSYFEKRAGVIGADVLQIAANVFEPFAKTNSLFAGGWLKIMERLGVKPRAGLDIARLLPINVEQEEIPAIEKQPERTFAASVYAGKRAEDYLVVDTETFAAPGTVGQKVSPKNQIPWQIAFAEAENPASVQQYLIRPEGVTKEDYERAKEEMMAVRPEVAEKMPSWETLEREGISYADALKKLRSAAKGRTIAGYNVGFDVGVLEAETMRYAVLGKGGKFLQKAAAEIQSGKPLFERVHDVMAGIRKIFSSEVDAYLNVDDENEKARRRKALGKYRLSGMYEAVSMADNLTGGLTPEQAHSADADVLATSYLLTKAIERGNAD
ncbi:MAG: hypothetical protein ONA90_05765, partial [candidate division KSB1 bacterium]|nr:hypothetical protein [candidate division KSB1 bacterium]